MMRIPSRKALALLFALDLSACSNLTEFEVDQTADFSSFDSFSVAAAETPQSHPTLPRHVDLAIAYQLTSKGLKRATSNDASVNIRYFLTLDENSSPEAEANQEETRGELVVDVQDSQTGDVIWRGRSARELVKKPGNDDVIAESVQLWVSDVLEQYPGR